jgi:hypothetical protein
MTDRIGLPKITIQKDAKAHPFPLQIAWQTQEFLHGAIFYFIISDESSGIFFRTPNAINILESSLVKKGMKNPEWDLGWSIFQKYKSSFENMVYRNVLISIRSYWDWYINQLSGFIVFAQEKMGNPLTVKEIKLSSRITRPEIIDQISLVEKTCLLDFHISEETKSNIKELSLVRNLGLHNRWEVDKQYILKTKVSKIFKTGDMRNFTAEELQLWHKALIELIHNTSIPLATKYLYAPTYPLTS